MNLQIKSAIKVKGFKINNTFKYFIPVILLIIFFIMISYLKRPDNIKNEEYVSLKIPQGSTLSSIADTLEAHALIENKKMFTLWVSLMGHEKSLKAGYFEIPRHLNFAQIIDFLSEAKPVEIKITLIEGWSNQEMASHLATKLEIDSTEFMNLTKNKTFISSLDVNAESLTGYLLPDTYYFYWGTKAKTILEYLVDNTNQIFDDNAQEQMDSLGMTKHEILTLASIIEGEAIFDDERRLISSVYYNRLNKRIKLQADPTIQYVIPGPPRRLLYKDLEVDSPYNTYKYYGLPPGPINNPGKQSILAALYPEKSDYLYFVATGDGRHSFTRTARAHINEKKKLNRIRREYYRKQKNSQN